jgi:predicted RND superfamily exporter protein
MANDPRMTQVQHQLEQFRDALGNMPLAEWYSRVDRYQQQMAGDLLSRLHALRSVANPEPPKLTDLPEGLVTRFVSSKGRYLLRIHAKGDIWNMDAMKKFVEDVRSVDPAATGNPLQTYEASRQMKRSCEQAAWYALAGVLLVVFVDMRSLRYTLLAVLPLAVGMLQTFGTLGLLDIPLNPANMIVLPLILGIGVNNGAHVVHDFRSRKGRYRMSTSTATAVLLTSLTTMAGFGSLIIADHRGLQSLGRVLTIGVGWCLFASLVMLPALLTCCSRHRADEGGEKEEEATVQRPEDLGLHGDPSASRKTYRRDAAHDHPGTSTHVVGIPATRYDLSDKDR